MTGMLSEKSRFRFLGCLVLPTLITILAPASSRAQEGSFHVEESSITDIQNAIRSGQTTCEGVVQAYLARAKAYNGVCTALLTKDGAPIAPAKGMVRAGSVLE